MQHAGIYRCFDNNNSAIRSIDYDFTEVCIQGSNNQYSSIGSNNGLATSQYLNQKWLVCLRIYVSFGLNESISSIRLPRSPWHNRAFCLYLYVIRHGGWNHHMRYQSIIWTGLPGVYWHLPMPQLNWNWKPSVLSHPDLRRAIYKIYIVISLDLSHDSVNMITKQIRVTV